MVIGGKIVNPGDIIVGDDDGVVIIDPAIADEVADATLAVEKKEADIMKHILEDGTYIRPWVDEKRKSAAVLRKRPIINVKAFLDGAPVNDDNK